VYVDDAVYAISVILKKLKGFNIFNVGSGKSYSIKKIYEILCRICDRKVLIVSTRQNSRKFDIENVVADSSKIRQLGWEPKVDIECGLKMTVDWYKNQLRLAKYSKHN
jgi:nucleoside-diphosphate-sugar epimerase